MKAPPSRRRPPGRDELAASRPAVLAALTLSFVAALAVFAAVPTGNIVIVNSDSSVAKYTAAQDAFRESLGQPVTVLDIATLTPADAERAIRAASPASVYSIGAKAFQAASSAAKGKPIVLSSAINWERLPAAKNPGTHVIATELPSGTQLTLFRYFFPQVKRIGVLFSAEFNHQWMAGAIAAGREVGIEVVGVSVRSTSAARSAAAKLLPTVDALWLAADPTVLADEAAVRALFEACASAHKPVFAYSTAFAQFNPTLIVAADVPTIGRQAAGLLRNQPPGAKKIVQSPAGSEVTLNLRAVKQYQLQLNEDAMDAVNHVIR